MKLKVLVVDDTLAHQMAMRAYLKPYGFEVDTASNGLDALGKVAANAYDMVFTDIEMPNMNGLELLARLKRMPSMAKAHVVMTSSIDDPQTFQKAGKLGASAYCTKPYDQAKIDRVLAKFGHRRTP